MIEETQEGPKWLKELEEKREKRLKARLGHEAGAGSPCLTCEEKCPGLDLHFWRKICKNCKCGKENHDVNDDDIYGWAQFQLLGSKPTKPKKIVLPGRNDAVELEWTPKGQNDVVESYLKDLPVNLLPIKGSAAAQERKQLLQKQIPLHDIDPALCHALSENEIEQMNDYIAHVKQNSVGVGHIMKLNELLKNRLSAANAQLLSSRTPMQIPQGENIVLQGGDRANPLKVGNGGHGDDLHQALRDDLHKALKDLSVDEQNPINVSQGEQVANANTIRDVVYGTYGQNKDGNEDRSHTSSLSRAPGELRDVGYGSYHQNTGVYHNSHANPLSWGSGEGKAVGHGTYGHNKSGNPLIVAPRELQNIPNFGAVSQHNLKNMQMPQPLLANQIDYQNSTKVGNMWDIKYPLGRQEVPNRPICNENDYQNPLDIRYPCINQNVESKLAQNPNYPIYSQVDHEKPSGFGPFRGIQFPDKSQIKNQSSHLQNHPPYPQNQSPHLPNQCYPKNQPPHLQNQPLYPQSQPPYPKTRPPYPQNQPCPQNQSPYSQNQPPYPQTQPPYPKTQPPYPQNQPHLQAKQLSEGFPANYAQMRPQNTQNLPHYANSSIKNLVNTQKPVAYDIRNVYPDMNVNYDPDTHFGDLGTNSEKLDNVLSLKGTTEMPHYVPGKFTTFAEQQNPQKFGNIKDLAYSTYDRNLDASNENLDDMNLNSSNTQRPANYNPSEINVTEQNLDPTSINVGIINDIEYPTIKSAIHKQNDFELDIPRKNVQFDLNPQEILPSCHKCKKMFDATALVIGIDRTDALWHADCFKCTGCNQNLADLMYFYHKESDDIYCGRDYAKIRGIPRCQACDELIFVKEYCLAENSTFHVKHFCCFECDEPLAGQNYVMEDSQPLCLPCFEKVKAEKCNACLKVIKPDEQGANLNGVHFHADDDCFACKMCKKPLLGAKLLFKNRNLYCSAPCFGADK